MSIFIPDRAITLTRDVAVPQSLSETLSIQQKRDVVFLPKKRFDGTYVDAVTNTKASCAINGTRYGIVNGVVTLLEANKPPVEDKGLRGCPAFTQLAKMTETLTDVNWKGFASATTISTPFMGANTHFIKEINSDGTPKKHTKYQDTAYTGIADNSIIGFSFIAKSSNRNIRVSLITKANITVNVVDFSMSTGVSSAIMAGATASIISLGAGWYHCSCSVSCLSGTTTPILFIALLSGSSDLYIGDGISGAYIGQPTYINFGVNGTPFIPPYVPNNTTSSVSVVSEAATATTGTSFDLDNALLARLKNDLRGHTKRMPEKHDLSTDIAGYFNTNSTTEPLNMSANARTTAWIPTEGFSIFEIVSNGTRSRVQCKKEDGTIFFLQESATAPYRITIPAGYTYFRIYYEVDISTNPTATLSAKAVFSQGHLELIFESNVDSGWLANSSGFNVMSINNQQYTNGALFFYKNSSGGLTFNLRDGLPNEAIISNMPTFTVGQTFKISIDYGTYTDGSQKMRLTVNGVRPSVAAFSGSFGTQDLRFFYGNLVHFGWIKDIKYYDRPRW